MTTTLQPSAQRIQDILVSYNVPTHVVAFKEFTRTAQEAADAIGCQLGQIAKTILFKTKNTGAPVCVIASGKNRIDERKVEQYSGQAVEKATAQDVLAYTGFAIGGVPPIGFTLETKPIIDEDLFAYPELWAAAGTPHAVFKIIPEQLLAITQGIVAQVRS